MIMKINELIKTIREHKGAEIATITICTDARLKKTGNPFGKVKKRSKLNVMIGADYSNMVNNQREREKLERILFNERKWGKRIDLKTVEHKGEIYLTIHVLKNYHTDYIDEHGNVLTRKQIESFLPVKRKPATQGTEKEIIYRDIKVKNIECMNFRGNSISVL